MRKVAAIPGAVDVHIHQIVDYPQVQVHVDRSKADQLGLRSATSPIVFSFRSVPAAKRRRTNG
jgi:Cu/Ag efflux pump CusA